MTSQPATTTLLTYSAAARHLGITLETFRQSWLSAGWIHPVPGHPGFVRSRDLEFARSVRSRCRIHRLYDAAGAARFLGLLPRAFPAFARRHQLREAVPGSRLFCFQDLERVLVALRGIPDPILKSHAAALLGFDHPTRLNPFVRAAKLKFVRTDPHRTWFSRAQVEAVLQQKAQQRRRLDAGVAAGDLLLPRECARRLKVSVTAVYQLFTSGRLTAVRFPYLANKTAALASEVAAHLANRTVKGPRQSGLPPGVLTTRQAAKELGISVDLLHKHIHRGDLAVAARGRWGRRAALGFAPADIAAFKRTRIR